MLLLACAYYLLYAIAKAAYNNGTLWKHMPPFVLCTKWKQLRTWTQTAENMFACIALCERARLTKISSASGCNADCFKSSWDFFYFGKESLGGGKTHPTMQLHSLQALSQKKILLLVTSNALKCWKCACLHMYLEICVVIMLYSLHLRNYCCPRPLEKVYKLFLEIKLYSPAFYVWKKSKLHV